MEIYVKDRLVSAEAETDSILGFCDNAPSARSFIQHVVSSAEGVFLWAELVLKTICSEMRKGRDLGQLNQAVSSFPNNLDDYFRKFIFDRIHRTRQNVPDTAAALKLALVIALDSKPGTLQLPHATSFCNFWLLSKGYLKSSFTWTDPIDTSPLSQEPMVRQTANFVHEVCKDLLVVRHERKGVVSVGFLHRTVFDFLCEANMIDFLDQHAPGHFSNEDFAANLARIRCICLLSRDNASREWSMEVLESAYACKARFWRRDQSDVDWFAAIESLTLKQINNGKCDCFGLRHVPSEHFFSFCIYAGRYHFLIESTASMPHHVFRRSKYEALGPNMLGRLFAAATDIDIGDSGVLLLRRLLEYGCHSFSLVEGWPSWRTLELGWCERTCWEALLGRLYIQLHRACRVIEEDKEIEDKERESTALRRRAVTIMELLLRHGANPSCSPCIMDHGEALGTGLGCCRIPLSVPLERIFPAEERFPLQRTLKEVTLPSKHHVLRRDQHRRAMRSLIKSQDNVKNRLAKVDISLRKRKAVVLTWLGQREIFLECMTNLRISGPLRQSQCRRCYHYIDRRGLVAWCVDCQVSFCICTDCYQLSPSTWPPVEHPCEAFPGMPPEDHTKIALAIGENEEWYCRDDPLAYLRTEYSVGKAADVLKAWYLRNPI